MPSTFDAVDIVPEALAFDCIFVAAGREPSGFASTVRSPDGLRRSADIVRVPFGISRGSGGASAVASH